MPTEAPLPVPSIGRIVRYRLNAAQAEQINRRRKDAREKMPLHGFFKTGAQVHVGNDVKAEDEFPMIITRVWGSGPDSYVNGQLFLDGNDLFWVTSVKVGEGSGTFSWPTRS